MAVEYDRIGRGYVAHRRPDPRVAAQIHRALGDARTVVNVGAGAGSYEPADRPVVAVEPSATMRAQRPAGAAPCVAGVAEALPLADGAADAALALLTVHHWADRRAGIDELRRVSRRQVLFTLDPAPHLDFWLLRDYLPEIRELRGSQPPAPDELAAWLGGGRVEVVPVPHDCVDGFLWAYWRRPERLLDPTVWGTISGLAQLPRPLVAERMGRLADDLASGAWAERNAELAGLDEVDGGFRLVVAG